MCVIAKQSKYRKLYSSIKNSQFSILNPQFRKAALVLITLVATLTLSACAGLLEDHVEIVTAHEAPPFERPPAQQVTISDTDEFRELLFEMIMTHQEQMTVQYQGSDNDDIQQLAEGISLEIMQTNPFAAYAVSDIKVTTAQIVTYHEVVLEIEFKRSAEQIESVINASTQRYMSTRLLDLMREYSEEAVFYTNLQLDREEIISQIVELYYQNPRDLVMMPFITVEVYGADGEADADNRDDDGEGDRQDREAEHRIYEIRFGYTEDTDMLRGMRDNLDSFVRTNAARAGGETDGEILLSLAQNLIAGAQYDEGTAGTIAMHGPQNIAATAFGALVRGSAVGEGFAMAFKALCDELQLDCRVVLGFFGERYHAWNIVYLDGYYYHIDAAMCAAVGLEAGFLKTDEDFAEQYSWDTERTPRCAGTLTLTDLLPPEEEPSEPAEPDDDDDTDDTGDTAQPNRPSDEPTEPEEPEVPDEPAEPSEPEVPDEPEEPNEQEAHEMT